MLLSSLPADTLITALETRPEADLTLDLVQSKLIEAGQRGMRNLNIDTALKTSLKHETKQQLCYFCHKSGHLKKNCKRYKDWKVKNAGNQNVTDSSDNEVAFCVSIKEPVKLFLLVKMAMKLLLVWKMFCTFRN